MSNFEDDYLLLDTNYCIEDEQMDVDMDTETKQEIYDIKRLCDETVGVSVLDKDLEVFKVDEKVKDKFEEDSDDEFWEDEEEDDVCVELDTTKININNENFIKVLDKNYTKNLTTINKLKEVYKTKPHELPPYVTTLQTLPSSVPGEPNHIIPLVLDQNQEVIWVHTKMTDCSYYTATLVNEDNQPTTTLVPWVSYNDDSDARKYMSDLNDMVTDSDKQQDSVFTNIKNYWKRNIKHILVIQTAYAAGNRCDKVVNGITFAHFNYCTYRNRYICINVANILMKHSNETQDLKLGNINSLFVEPINAVLYCTKRAGCIDIAINSKILPIYPLINNKLINLISYYNINNIIPTPVTDIVKPTHKPTGEQYCKVAKYPSSINLVDFVSMMCNRMSFKDQKASYKMQFALRFGYKLPIIKMNV